MVALPPYTTLRSDDGCRFNLACPSGDLVVPFGDDLVHRAIRALKRVVWEVIDGLDRGGIYNYYAVGLPSPRGGTRLADLMRYEAERFDVLGFTSPKLPATPISATRHRAKFRRFHSSAGDSERFLDTFIEPQVHIVNVVHNPHLHSAGKLEQILDLFCVLGEGVEAFHNVLNRAMDQEPPYERHRYGYRHPSWFRGKLQEAERAYITDRLVGALRPMELRARLNHIATLAQLDTPDVLCAALELWSDEGWEGEDIAMSYLEYAA